MKIALIFPDQLSNKSYLFLNLESYDQIILFEPLDNFYEIPHHKQKIAFLISSLRHIKQEINHPNIKHEKIIKDHPGLIKFLNNQNEIEPITSIDTVQPSDHKILRDLLFFSQTNSIELNVHNDSKFIAKLEDFEYWSKDKKSLIQEFYYRWLRKKYNILMNDNEPAGGQWNFDKENRKSIKQLKDEIPKRNSLKTDKETFDVMVDVETSFPDAFGSLENFNWAVTRSDAKLKLKEFISSYLFNYGNFQDAMSKDSSLLFHSLISPYLNNGLLCPMEAIDLVELEYKNNQAPINAVEGFVRQILGWREFIRGIYWKYMPQYKTLNFFDTKTKLPEFYWNAETDMYCMHKAISDTKEYAYSHHIQRLMVTGNFALIAGLNPQKVCDWYLGVYVDAHEWVELPNTLGMALFADGGIVGSKPYAASGKYINRMSNFCKDCKYDVNTIIEDDSCPMNFMYWNFLISRENILRKNPRMSLIYNSLDKKDDLFKSKVQAKSKIFIKDIT